MPVTYQRTFVENVRRCHVHITPRVLCVHAHSHIAHTYIYIMQTQYTYIYIIRAYIIILDIAFKTQLVAFEPPLLNIVYAITSTYCKYKYIIYIWVYALYSVDQSKKFGNSRLFGVVDPRIVVSITM